MAIELKDILTFTGIEADSIEDFKAGFEKTFLKRDAALKDKEFVNSVVGKRLHGVSNKLKNQLTKYGVEISDTDAKEKPLEELIEMGFERYNEATQGTITELTEKANKNSGEQTKDLQEKYSKLESKFNDTKKSLTDLSAEYTGFKEKAANDLKGVKIQTIREQAMSKIPRRSDIEAKQYGLMLTGFENTIDSKFKIDLDENNQPYIADKKTGERFRNPAKASEFFTVEEMLKQEALELGISPKNPFTAPSKVHLQQQNGNGNGHQQQQQAPERPRASRKA